MSQYKSYPAYKDSRAEWIGEVPEHWKVVPVKYHYDARLGKMIQPAAASDSDIAVPYHRAQTVQWERVVESDVREMWASINDIEQFSVNKGDLLICEGGDVCRAAIVQESPASNMIFQNSIHRVRPKGQHGVAWILRLMQHLRSSGWVDVLCNKNTIVHFTSEKLGSLECPLPPPEEQAIIEAAIEFETTRIDTLIAKKVRFIELLKEKRQAVITKAVTKGLDDSVEMKDSGVEWLGSVPIHWKAVKLRYISKFSGGGTPNRDEATYWNGSIPWVSPKDMKSDEITGTQEYITELGFQNSSTSIVPIDNVLIVVRSGILKHTIPVAINKVETSLNQDMKAIELNKNICMPEFLLRWIQGLNRNLLLDWSKMGATVESIEHDFLARAIIPLPPIHEQKKILSFLRCYLQRLEGLIIKTERSIELLKEKRSALITAAVTGKIDVREAA